MVERQPRAQSARIPNPRSARIATERRVVRYSRARYRPIALALGTLIAVLVPVTGYVMLTSSMTGLTYAVGKAHAQRNRLRDETLRLEDRVEQLSSDARLARIAAQLHMHPASTAIAMQLEPAQAAQPRIAFLSDIARWFQRAPVKKRRS
ncbi:MAG TPA: hypothetical protein VMV73_00910 [Candidatus Dormibacteraeota bacterium]|nr:hypothetical protein [Candidatus Dormibacteraeota bacterium]